MRPATEQGKPYDAFLSYAGEERDLARELAGALKYRSIRVWYSETELRVGDSLLSSIDRGLQASRYGILLISKSYLGKNWPEYELDVLMRQRVEEQKPILPIWHGVTRVDIEAAHPGLAGIYALNTERGFEALVRGLEQVLIPNAATLARTSPWEDPLHRFLQGEGEATLLQGGTFTLWEAVIHFDQEGFPIRINDATLSREDLLSHALMNLTGDLSDTQMNWLRAVGYELVLDVLREEGVDLSVVAYKELPSPDQE